MTGRPNITLAIAEKDWTYSNAADIMVQQMKSGRGRGSFEDAFATCAGMRGRILQCIADKYDPQIVEATFRKLVAKRLGLDISAEAKEEECFIILSAEAFDPMHTYKDEVNFPEKFLAGEGSGRFRAGYALPIPGNEHLIDEKDARRFNRAVKTIEKITGQVDMSVAQGVDRRQIKDVDVVLPAFDFPTIGGVKGGPPPAHVALKALPATGSVTSTVTSNNAATAKALAAANAAAKAQKGGTP